MLPFSASMTLPSRTAEPFLVIEDDPIEAELLEAQFRLAGLSEPVVHAGDVAEGMVRLQREQCSMVFVGTLPGGQRRVDLVPRLRACAPTVPVVVVSSRPQENEAVELIRRGAQEIIDRDELSPGSLRRRLLLARERHRAACALTRLAHHDLLTGLANRRRFQDELRQTVARARRLESCFAVMFIDLDGFKAVNDTHGHDVGDALLVEVARRIEGLVRDYDTVARLGGDEFALILDPVDHVDAVAEVTERIRREVARPIQVDDCSLQVGASIGVGGFPEAGRTGADIVRVADLAMYDDKRLRKGASSATALDLAS